jgi:PAS domain S-box-containing protein
LLDAWPLSFTNQEARDDVVTDEPGETLPDGMPTGEQYRLEMERRVKQVEQNLDRRLGQVIGLPLLFEEEMLGVIYLFRGENAFSQLDWQFLQGFAHQAAIAVRNARLYQQLLTERGRLATIVENSASGIMILDADRRVLVINQALAAMTELTPKQAIGLACNQVLDLHNVTGAHLCDDEFALDAVAGPILRCEGDLVRPGGGHITVAVTYTPLSDDQGRLLNVIVNVSDITRFREEEEMKSTFISIISHELKTPVALIKGYAQTLARPDADWDQETAKQGLEIIEEEADRLESLINNLLDVSRIQAGGLRLDIGDVNMHRLLSRVAQDYRTQTQIHDIRVDLPENLPIISGDEERLRQVFTNLLSNAIKYAPGGGQIRIGGWLEDGDESQPARLTLYVADEGIGIPEADLPLIFERFYRVDSSLRRGTAGVGLGLFLIQAIVHAHQGEIWVRSQVDKGTTFFVALPLEQI